MIVAATPSMYAGGANCGKMVSITNQKTGTTQQAKIVDLCPTCGGSQDLDMSKGLFSALGGTENEGVFPISWSFGSDSSNSNKNENKSNKQNYQSDSSASKTSAASSHSASASATATSSAKAESTNGSQDSKNTVTGPVSWWETVQDYCNLDSKPENPVAISASRLYSVEDLSKACGKTVSIKNPSNGQTVKGTVTSYLPSGEQNSIALADAYKQLAGDAGSVDSAEWGFTDSN